MTKAFVLRCRDSSYCVFLRDVALHLWKVCVCYLLSLLNTHIAQGPVLIVQMLSFLRGDSLSLNLDFRMFLSIRRPLRWGIIGLSYKGGRQIPYPVLQFLLSLMPLCLLPLEPLLN